MCYECILDELFVGVGSKMIKTKLKSRIYTRDVRNNKDKLRIYSLLFLT